MTRQTDSTPPGSEPSESGPAVVYFAKAPVSGQVKTRLCPPLTYSEAAALYGAFVRRIVVSIPGTRTLVYGWPPDRLAEIEALVPAEVEVRPQRGGDLFARMVACLDELFGEGHGPVLIRNTDSPDMPVERVLEALARSRPGHVVLGPDFGGGYYLVSLADPPGELFSRLDEGEDTVLARTESRARELGLTVERLAFERDVDTFDDLVEMWRSRSSRPT